MKGGVPWGNPFRSKGKSVANKYLNYPNPNTNPNPNNGAISASNQIVNTTFGSFGVNNKQSTSPEAASTTSTQIRRPHRPAPPPPTQTQIAAKAASTSTHQNESCSRQKAKECASCIANVKVINNSEEERRKFEMLSELGMVFVSLHDYDHDGYLTVKEGDLLFIESEEDEDFYNNSINDDNFEFTNTRTGESGLLPKSYVMRYQATHTAKRKVESDEASIINSDVTTSIGMDQDDKLILFASKKTGVVKVYNMTRRAVGTVPEDAIEPSPAAAAEPEAAEPEAAAAEAAADSHPTLNRGEKLYLSPPKEEKLAVKQHEAKAFHDYEPNDGDRYYRYKCIGIKKGDTVEVIEQYKIGWSLVVKDDGTFGVVPTSYLKPTASAA